jgi:hypothetical protein
MVYPDQTSGYCIADSLAWIIFKWSTKDQHIFVNIIQAKDNLLHQTIFIDFL